MIWRPYYILFPRVSFSTATGNTQPLLIHRGDAEFYEQLLTDRNLEDIISTSDLRYPAIRLAKEGLLLSAPYLHNRYHSRSTDVQWRAGRQQGFPGVW